MKLATFEVSTVLGRHQRLGAVTDNGIVDLNFAYAAWLATQGERRPHVVANALLPANMLEFLDAGAHTRAVQALDCASRTECGPNGERLVHDHDEVRLLTPLPNPRSLRDFYAFEAHVKTGFEKRGEPMPAEWYQMPVYYKSGHHSIIGTGADVLWPSFTEKFDYELELAAVIGKQGRNVPVSEASQYIAGYMVMNDFSARDIQKREMKVRLGPAKGKDWCTALGPYLVTTDEIANPYDLRMTARVNGELWSEGNSSSLHYSFEEMIAFLTQDDTIYPGDVIGSGTVGTGCGLELDRWVKPGDVLELEIAGIGKLINRVVR